MGKTEQSIICRRHSLILLANTKEGLQKIITSLNEEGRKDGMKINTTKNFMCNEIAKRTTRQGIKIDGEILEEVIEYKYLGRWITANNQVDREIDQKINTGLKRFRK